MTETRLNLKSDWNVTRLDMNILVTTWRLKVHKLAARVSQIVMRR